MLQKIWDALSAGLTQRLSFPHLLAAVAFWGAGLFTVAWNVGWAAFLSWLLETDVTTSVLRGIALLVVAIASTALVDLLETSVLQAVEGYWPYPFAKLVPWLAELQFRCYWKKRELWERLNSIRESRLSGRMCAARASLDADLTHYPTRRNRFLPTRIGNILRAAEEYPQVRYGLAMSVCWPRLWLVLPEKAREEVNEARGQLDAAAQGFLWSILFLSWVQAAWWALILSALGMCIAYQEMKRAAALYGDLLRASFDLYRFELYAQVHLKPPKWADGEEVDGSKLTEYLFRGQAAAGTPFTRPSNPAS